MTIIFISIGILSCNNEDNKDFSEEVKVALRNVGHQLLLANDDATSLVQPVLALENSKYQLSFQKDLIIEPDNLVKLIKNSFQKADLPPYYLTEVVQCKDQEVGYSYQIELTDEKGIIPCQGRLLPKACYKIQVRFTKPLEKSSTTSMYLIYAVLFGGLIVLILIIYKKKTTRATKTNDTAYMAIGRFKFYPEQNKLIREATEISLSKKECELLAIFVAQPNQIIKRDELTKKVWEDNGVIVGRSLDTYISKLRKKLKDDDSIKLTNVHGVGYKLEIG
ncbi:MAG: winged helix-turn-helix domain-containing protein [Cellulophaga sp.]